LTAHDESLGGHNLIKNYLMPPGLNQVVIYSLYRITRNAWRVVFRSFFRLKRLTLMKTGLWAYHGGFLRGNHPLDPVPTYIISISPQHLSLSFKIIV
jgi:hypothetical protein